MKTLLLKGVTKLADNLGYPVYMIGERTLYRVPEYASREARLAITGATMTVKVTDKPHKGAVCLRVTRTGIAQIYSTLPGETLELLGVRKDPRGWVPCNRWVSAKVHSPKLPKDARRVSMIKSSGHYFHCDKLYFIELCSDLEYLFPELYERNNGFRFDLLVSKRESAGMYRVDVKACRVDIPILDFGSSLPEGARELLTQSNDTFCSRWLGIDMMVESRQETARKAVETRRRNALIKEGGV